MHLDRCEHAQPEYKVIDSSNLCWPCHLHRLQLDPRQRNMRPTMRMWDVDPFATSCLQETFTASGTGANLGDAACKYDKQC